MSERPLTPSALFDREMTARQRAYLAFIASSPVSPSIKELSDAFGVASTNAVSDVLVGLERRGCIERTGRGPTGVRGHSRNIVVTDRGWEMLGVPLCPTCGQRMRARPRVGVIDVA